MPRNIEIKAHCANINLLEGLVKSIADSTQPTVQNQEDTFFKVPQGRLKLRQHHTNGRGELIYYERSDQTGPKLSDYSKAEITSGGEVSQLKDTLLKTLGAAGVVRKRRHIYFKGQTKIHVDSVEKLGDFVELEVMLQDDQTVEHGTTVANEIMKQLGIKESDLIPTAYVDMMN